MDLKIIIASSDHILFSFFSIYIFILMFCFAFLCLFYLFCSLQVFADLSSLSLLIAQLILCLFDLQFGQKKQKNLQHLRAAISI